MYSKLLVTSSIGATVFCNQCIPCYFLGHWYAVTFIPASRIPVLFFRGRINCFAGVSRGFHRLSRQIEEAV